jgi:hypothetical protein
MFDFDTLIYKNFKFFNYNSIDLSEVREYLDSLSSDWLIKVKISEGTTLEKVCQDFYSSQNYNDLIMFLNDRDYLFDYFHLFDVVSELSDRNLEEYYFKAFGDSLYPFKQNLNLKLDDTVREDLEKQNQDNSYIILIHPLYVSKVNSKIKQILETQKDMYNLLDLEQNAEGNNV